MAKRRQPQLGTGTAEPRSIAATRALTIALRNAAFAGERSKLSIQVTDIVPASGSYIEPEEWMRGFRGDEDMKEAGL